MKPNKRNRPFLNRCPKSRQQALKQAVVDIKRRYGEKAIQKGWQK